MTILFFAAAACVVIAFGLPRLYPPAAVAARAFAGSGLARTFRGSAR